MSNRRVNVKTHDGAFGYIFWISRFDDELTAPNCFAMYKRVPEWLSGLAA